jgi:hypothetical protein
VSEFRPSALVRWPLHFLNVLLLFVILLLAGSVVFFRYIETEPMWGLVFGGCGVCLFFVMFNLFVAGMKLHVEEERILLAVGLWRRSVATRGALVCKEIRPVGITGVNIQPAQEGKKLYLNPAWFAKFDDALEEIEGVVRAAGGKVEEISIQ